MNHQWEITEETKPLPKLKNPLFIEGLPGIGNVGKISVDFLVEELGAKKLYSFYSHKFPHSVFINEDNLIDMPKIEIYYKKYGTKSMKRDLLLLTGDIQPIDEESCYSFCEEILKIIKYYGCKEMITTGGIGLQSVPDKPRVYCAGNNSKLLKEYTKKVLLVEKEIFGVVGPIVGVSGILLGLGARKNVKGVALLAETFANPLYLGIKGAKEILQVIEIKFGLGLNLKKIHKEILEVEDELIKRTKEWVSKDSALSQAGTQARENEAHYIG